MNVTQRLNSNTSRFSTLYYYCMETIYFKNPSRTLLNQTNTSFSVSSDFYCIISILGLDIDNSEFIHDINPCEIYKFHIMNKFNKKFL